MLPFCCRIMHPYIKSSMSTGMESRKRAIIAFIPFNWYMHKHNWIVLYRGEAVNNSWFRQLSLLRILWLFMQRIYMKSAYVDAQLFTMCSTHRARGILVFYLHEPNVGRWHGSWFRCWPFVVVETLLLSNPTIEFVRIHRINSNYRIRTANRSHFPPNYTAGINYSSAS